jgi:hypothetical protein
LVIEETLRGFETTFTTAEGTRNATYANALQTANATIAEMVEAGRSLALEMVETERATAQEMIDAERVAARAMVASGESSTSKLLEEIQGMRDNAAALLGAIGRDGMSVGYQSYSDNEQRAADVWRWISMGLGVISVLVLAWMVHLITQIEHPTVGDYTGRYGIAVLLAGLAGYAARQSGEHRKRAAEARAVSLLSRHWVPTLNPCG